MTVKQAWREMLAADQEVFAARAEHEPKCADCHMRALKALNAAIRARATFSDELKVYDV